MELSGEKVLAAAARWIWVPVDARDLTTADYRVTHYTGYTSVQWSRTERPLTDLLAEVTDLARDAGSDRLRWWVTERTEPAGTDRQLAAAGFRHVETVEVLALPLEAAVAGGIPAPADVEVVDVRDRETLETAARLGAEVFSWEPPTAAQLDEELAVITEPGPVWRMRRYLARVDGRPAATAGATVDEDALRLWGGSVVPPLRGRGAYRALVARRLLDARATTASYALVKAVDDTSSPILRRLGFQVYGAERCFQLALS